MTEIVETSASPPAPSYSVSDALKYGWQRFEARAGQILALGFALLIPFFAIGIAAFIVMGATSVPVTEQDPVNGGMTRTSHLTAAGGIAFGTAALLMVLLAIAISVGLIRATLKVLDGKPFSILDLVSLRRFGTVLMILVVTGIGTGIGLIFCVIPGLAFAVLAQYSLWFALDQGQGPFKAIGSSFDFASRNIGPVLLFWFVSVALLMIAYSACIFGLLIAIPVVQIGTGYTYRRLQGLPVS